MELGKSLLQLRKKVKKAKIGERNLKTIAKQQQSNLKCKLKLEEKYTRRE